MDILADENVDRPIVVWLREQGHDVRWSAEVDAGREDEAVLASARSAGRVLVTADLDFGEHVFRYGRAPIGVVLLRIRTNSPTQLLERFCRAWCEVEDRLKGRFVVISNDRIRVRALPGESESEEG